MIGNKIGLLRCKLGLTQNMLAQKPGMTRQHINNIERGRQGTFHGRTLVKLAHGLDMSPEDLIEYLSTGEGSLKYTYEEILVQLLRDRKNFDVRLTITLAPRVNGEDKAK